MKNNFILDARLEKDCFQLGRLQGQHLLLFNNSLIPWFILVPETNVTEIHELDQQNQKTLLENMNRLSVYIKQNYSVDKLNIAAIGNIVSQLHVHVIGRNKTDFCWPDVVWGKTNKMPYDDAEPDRIREQLSQWFGDLFTVV